MREKIKSRKKRTILIASIVIVITLIAVGICLENNKTSLTIKKVEKIDNDITKLDVNEEKEEIILEEEIEDKGEESATEEVKTEVSNTPKVMIIRKLIVILKQIHLIQIIKIIQLSIIIKLHNNLLLSKKK